MGRVGKEEVGTTRGASALAGRFAVHFSGRDGLGSEEVAMLAWGSAALADFDSPEHGKSVPVQTARLDADDSPPSRRQTDRESTDAVL